MAYVFSGQVRAVEVPAPRGRSIFVPRLKPNVVVNPRIAEFGNPRPMIYQHFTIPIKPRRWGVIGIVKIAAAPERLVWAMPAVRADQLAVVIVA